MLCLYSRLADCKFPAQNLNKEVSVPYIYFANTHSYADGLIGLIDGDELNHKDWEDMHKAFGFIYPDGSEKLIYCMTGSEAATAMGLNPYSTAEKLRRKKNFDYEEDIDISTQFIFEYGHRNEELAAIGFHYRTGMEVVKDRSVFFNTKNGIMMANVDFFVINANNERFVLEIKTTSATSLWADKDVPANYKCQALLHYCKCLEALDLKGAYFCGMYDNILDHLMIRFFERMPLLESKLEREERKFISYCYKEEIIPFDEFGEDNNTIADDLKLQYPVAANEDSIDIDSDMKEEVAKYIELNNKISELNAQQKLLEEEQQPLKNKIIQAIGANKYATCNLGELKIKFTYDNRKGRASASVEEIRHNYPKVFDVFLDEGIISMGTPYRVLTVSKKKLTKKELKDSDVLNG